MRHRIALANLRFPTTPDDSIVLSCDAIAAAAAAHAEILCFPECFVPGYRAPHKPIPPPDQAFLTRAWASIAQATAQARIMVILGTERLIDNEPLPRATTLVLNPDGTTAGFQDKVQLDPSEDATYTPGTERLIFTSNGLTFGIAICHEGWRYPETVRWAARRGAHIVFHPQFHEHEPGAHIPSTYAEPANTFHEKALLCRAAENTCYIATVNCASPDSPTTSAFIHPDGTVLDYQPYGLEGLLLADIETNAATGLLASRLRS
jgi:predicted amidohydrolase